MKIDVKRQSVDLDGSQVYYPNLKQVQRINLHFGKADTHFDFGVGLYTTHVTIDQEFVAILEGDTIKYLYDDEDGFEEFLQKMESCGKLHLNMAYYIGTYHSSCCDDYRLGEGIPKSEKKLKLRICMAVAWKLKERYGQLPYWVISDLPLYWVNECKKDEFCPVGNLQKAYNLLNSVCPDNRRATEKKLLVEQEKQEKAEREKQQKEVNAEFEKKYGSISRLKADLIEWVHSDPEIDEVDQTYDKYEEAEERLRQDHLASGIENRYSDYEDDDRYNCYDYNAILERNRKIAEKCKKEKEERELRETQQENAKAPYQEFYSNALICIKLYFNEVYSFYCDAENERYSFSDDEEPQKALNYLCDTSAYPVARMKFYGAPSIQDVDVVVAKKRKDAISRYIQRMRMIFAQKGGFCDAELPEQKKELVAWRDRKVSFQLALKKYFGYQNNFEYVEYVLSEEELDEIKDAFADYLEFYQNAAVFVSDYLNEINRNKEKRKDIPQEDLDRALMYFYNTDSPEEAREAVREKKYKESRQYGEKGEAEVEYALKWLVGDYIKLKKDASGKYGTNAIVLNNKSFVDEPQEFDHIVIGPQGIFNIETKNYAGKIIVDREGNWIREQSDGRRIGERNPAQQSRRHEAVLRSIVGENVPIMSILVIANPKTIIQGAENSKVKLLKSDVLEEYIANYKGSVSYTKEKIQVLADEIEKYRVAK